MQEFFVALISLLLIEPLQSAMSERFGNVSREQVASVTACLQEATPVLIRQASDAPWQAATQVIGLWSGMTAPEDVLAQATSGCAETVEALRRADSAAES